MGTLLRRLHLGGHARHQDAQGTALPRRLLSGHRPRLHRLLGAGAADAREGVLCHQDEEKPRLRDTFKHHSCDTRRESGDESQHRALPQRGGDAYRQDDRVLDSRRPSRHASDQQLRHAGVGHRGGLRPSLADRTAFQTAEAELPPEVLLRRERQRHRVADMGHTDSQPAADGGAEEGETQMGLLQPRHRRAPDADVLCGHLRLP